jgi:3-phenylpropionate/cinnamic acid dioxygenase small subunit
MARGKKTDIEIPTREEMNNILIKSNWNLLRLCNKKMKEYVEETIITSQSDYSDFSRIKKQSIEMLNVLCDESSRSIKTRLRFKILKKNKFTCQYC